MEATLLLATGILNIVLGGYVIYRNPRRPLNLSLSLFALGASGWILSLWFTIYFFPILPVSKITFISPIFALAFLALFVYELEPKVLRKAPYVPILILLVPSIFIILILLDKVVTSVGVKNNHIVNTYGEAYPLYGITTLVYIFGSLFFLIYKYYRSQGVDRLRLKYVLLGLALMLIPSVATNLILPLMFKTQSFNTLGPVSSTFMVVMMTYAILRYHLLDIWVVIRLGTIFALLFGAISIIYVGVLNVLGQYLGGTASLLFTSLAIVITFEPLKKLIENFTDKYLFQKHYRVDEVINETTAIVHRLELDLNKISLLFNQLIEQYFKALSAAVAILTPNGSFLVKATSSDVDRQFELVADNPIVEFMSVNPGFVLHREDIELKLNSGDPELELEVDKIDLLPDAYQELIRLDFELAIPIEANERLIGIYFIGEKKSKDAYTVQDLKLLDHLTSEAGGLINNARLYEDLKKLDEAKSNFISVVSHQLRTPLSAMRWDTELLMDGKIDKRTQQEFLQDTYKNSLFMISHLDDMLIALDIEDKEVNLVNERCGLKTFIEEVMEENKLLIQQKQIKFDANLIAAATNLLVDCKKVKKIIGILLANAINYSPLNGGIISVLSKEIKKEGAKFLEITVKDNGIGITADEQRYIFQKFFRGESAKKMSPNGFGLGLFIVKAFVGAHGGMITFASAGRNKGAAFTFTLPL